MDITELFNEKEIVEKIQSKLPKLFYIAEIESSRAGKVGMEVGSARERVLIALLIHKFGPNNIETNLPITEPEVDVKVFNRPLSIKTITNHKLSGVKLCWTVDAAQAKKFTEDYSPRCDILLAQINWDQWGALYYFPQIAQVDVLEEFGKSRYFKLPKPGTNPRGVEASAQALEKLALHSSSIKMDIFWRIEKIQYDLYGRWIELWEKE